MSSIRPLPLLLLAALALPAVPSFAQETFSEATEVIAVEVPVQVLRDGEPVRGLTAADFEVFEGRRKLPVTGFEVLDLSVPEASPAKEAPLRPARPHGRGQDGADRLTAAFRAPRLQPGDYLLMITVVDPGGRSETSVTPFLVRGGGGNSGITGTRPSP